MAWSFGVETQFACVVYLDFVRERRRRARRRVFALEGDGLRAVKASSQAEDEAFAASVWVQVEGSRMASIWLCLVSLAAGIGRPGESRGGRQLLWLGGCGEIDLSDNRERSW